MRRPNLLRVRNRSGQKRKGQEKGNVDRRRLNLLGKRANLLGKMAPQAGLEPATLRLTAGCSAIELLRKIGGTRSLTCSPCCRLDASRTCHGTQSPNDRQTRTALEDVARFFGG